VRGVRVRGARGGASLHGPAVPRLLLHPEGRPVHRHAIPRVSPPLSFSSAFMDAALLLAPSVFIDFLAVRMLTSLKSKHSDIRFKSSLCGRIISPRPLVTDANLWLLSDP
jgi:hypothetical protein